MVNWRLALVKEEKPSETRLGVGDDLSGVVAEGLGVDLLEGNGNSGDGL